ncbi:MAG: SUMF1/EgtB/PvdO family nonheme iron enzyme [Phaeodactylibacter xiamenensis]|uniref:SUMF1/EgtB/PvdO family nonheme iron enzyme n=1 Tax=Phaeodactylibacter xiamenensis TaxID=1524460 RepID=UPI0007C91CD3|nr:SUMF1/EgtB/PvdO family nonheme iron enzyme [Phaeodactylibacter xiamenensis]MCR9054505.1 SUMF1/EgtB/PvdO family nonheme iron enzyme [bacterium]
MPEQHKGLDHEAMQQMALQQQGHTHLLVIGVDAYAHCPPLSNCVKDAKDFTALMQQQYQVSPERTYELYDAQATRTQVLRQLKNLRHKVQEDDSLIVYFSGHGEIEDEEGYWIPIEGKPGEDEGWIDASSIKRCLNQVESFHTLVIADACFAGSFFMSYKSATRQLLHSRRSRLGISASHSRERALDGQAGDNSPFAKELLRALRHNQQPLPVDQLFTQLRDAVAAATQGRQTPIFKNIDVKGDDQGQFVFVPVGDEVTAWEAAKAADTILAYFQYNQDYPDGKYRAEALAAIRRLEEEAHWQRAQQADTLSAYFEFLDRFPTGAFAEQAKQRQQELLSGYTEPKSPQPPKLKTKNPPTPKPKPSKPDLPPDLIKLSEDMVHIPGGTFWMGWKDEVRDGEGHDKEKPCHEVSLSDYYLGKYPVTQAQWKAVMGDNPSWFKNCPDCPVEQVSWDDVQEFIKKLNAKTGEKYRLPTEAEWEYGARGGAKDEYLYSGSNDLDEVGWYRDNSGGKIHPVGQKQPNQLGLYDMSGNVWEWVQDCWHEHYNGAPRDGGAWLEDSNGDCSRRVLRGGSWYFSSGGSRVAIRSRSIPSIRSSYLGFRLTRD